MIKETELLTMVQRVIVPIRPVLLIELTKTKEPTFD